MPWLFLPSRRCGRIILWTLLPIILCTLLAEGIHHQVKRVYIRAGYGSTSTLKTAYWALPKLIHPSAGDHDSWYPMLKGLAAFRLHRDEGIYRATFLNQSIPAALRPKFQYPPMSLLPLEALSKLGLLTQDDAAVGNIGVTEFHDARTATLQSYHLLNSINSFLFVLNALAIGYFTWRTFRRKNAAQSPADSWWLAGSAALTCFLFYPYTQALNLGQIQIWLDLLLTLACIAWLGERRGVAGACMALICMVKPQIGLIFLWALLWRDWRFVKGFLLAGIPIAAFSLWHYGLANHLDYLNVLSVLSHTGESYLFNASVNGLLHRFLFEGDNTAWSFKYATAPYDPFVYAVTLVTSLLFVALALWPALSAKGQKPTLLDFGLAVTCFTIGSPVAWDHHYGFLLPFLIFLAARMLATPPAPSRRNGLILLVVSWTLIANLMTYFNLFADSHLNVLESYRFFGGLIFVGLLLHVSRRETHPRAKTIPAG